MSLEAQCRCKGWWCTMNWNTNSWCNFFYCCLHWEFCNAKDDNALWDRNSWYKNLSVSFLKNYLCSCKRCTTGHKQVMQNLVCIWRNLQMDVQSDINACKNLVCLSWRTLLLQSMMHNGTQTLEAKNLCIFLEELLSCQGWLQNQAKSLWCRNLSSDSEELSGCNGWLHNWTQNSLSKKFLCLSEEHSSCKGRRQVLTLGVFYFGSAIS